MLRVGSLGLLEEHSSARSFLFDIICYSIKQLLIRWWCWADTLWGVFTSLILCFSNQMIAELRILWLMGVSLYIFDKTNCLRTKRFISWTDLIRNYICKKSYRYLEFESEEMETCKKTEDVYMRKMKESCLIVNCVWRSQDDELRCWADDAHMCVDQVHVPMIYETVNCLTRWGLIRLGIENYKRKL